MQILLLEDDDDLRSEVHEFLVRRRHGVTALKSAAEARPLLNRLLSPDDRLDAVICDINLQDGDGIDLYIEFAPQRPACRWILMSGDLDLQRLAAAQSARPALPRCIVVEKPVSLRELADLLTSGATAS